MKRIIGYSIAFIFAGYLITYFLIYNAFFRMPAESVFNDQSSEMVLNKYKVAEEELFRFIEDKFIGENGEVYTNIKPGSEGKDTLSESVGILMNYCIMKDRKDLFDKEFAFLRNSLLIDGSFVKWRSGDNANCNSLIDDMRIGRALMDAYGKWGETAYRDTAGFIQEAIYNTQVVGDRLCEFYDWKFNVPREIIPLCYMDFYTLERLQPFNSKWRSIADKGLWDVKNGIFKKNSPFYYKYFDYNSESYSADEEMKDNKGICLTYTIYTALHLAEINEDTEGFRSWLKKEMKKGRLYAWYNPRTLKPSRKIESTAVYALAAVYAKKVGENDLAEKLVDRMEDFRVKSRKSPYFGGYGDEKTVNFYSFDNLTALWALAVMGEENGNR